MAAFELRWQSRALARDCLVCKSENIYYLIFYRKSLLTPALDFKINCWKHEHFSPTPWIFILFYSREHILDLTSFHRQKSALTPALCRGIGSQSEVHGPEAIQLPVNLLEIYIIESHSRPTYQKLRTGTTCVHLNRSSR